MALIICSECGKEFSDKAAACPNCGCPTEEAIKQHVPEPIVPENPMVETYDTVPEKTQILQDQFENARVLETDVYTHDRYRSIMKAIYSLIRTVIQLVIAFTFMMPAIGYIPELTGFLALMVVALVLPIAKWQNILSRILPRRWLKVVLAVVLMVSTIIATPEETGAQEPPKPTSEVVEDVAVKATEALKPTSAPSPTPTPSPAPTPTPKPTPTPVPTPVPASEIMAQMEAAAKEHLDYFMVEGDETGISVWIAMDGVAEGLVLASALGFDETFEPWVANREALLNFYFLFEDLIAANGRSDLVLMVSLVNDTNYDNVLLSAYRGEIVYDEMAIRSSR